MKDNHPYYQQYSCDKNGVIYGIRGIVKPTVHHTGYGVITVKGKQYRTHRFIWECINGIITDNLVINHIDGDKLNNNITNLELVTNKYNTNHAFSLGLMKGIIGKDNINSKLTEEQVRLIVQEYEENPKIPNGYWASKYNVHPNYISLVKTKRRWKYLWK